MIFISRVYEFYLTHTFYRSAIKTDVNGEIIWANRYTHPDFAQINDIAEISDNHYLVTASLRFPGDFEFEGVVYIIDDEGEIYWSGKNGNPQNAGQDFYNGIYSEPDGELIIGGFQESNDNLRYIYRSRDFTLTKDFLCELDSISIDKIDITNELVLENPTIQINTANVEVSIVGMTVSTLNNLELIDVCTQDLSVNNQEVEVAQGLNISPNPFDEFLSIESELTGNVKVELFDMLGKQISVEEINSVSYTHLTLPTICSV